MTRRLSESDRRIWARVARTVRAAPGRRPPESTPVEGILAEPEPPSAPLSSTPAAVQVAPAGARSAKRPAPGPLADVSGQKRVRRGQTPVDARLDLHGHTQDSAYRELVAFLSRERAAGSKCVLVITGKGRLGVGVLRARFFEWIAGPDLRPMIAGYSRAHARHGGEGAFYLLLKVRKD